MGEGGAKLLGPALSFLIQRGLGDLGVGGLVKHAFFLSLFPAFSLPGSHPRFHHCAARGPSLLRSQTLGPCSSGPCACGGSACHWLMGCPLLLLLLLILSGASEASQYPSSLGPGELGETLRQRRGAAVNAGASPDCAKRGLYAEPCDRALGFGCLGKAFLVHVGTEPKHAV